MAVTTSGNRFLVGVGVCAAAVVTGLFAPALARAEPYTWDKELFVKMRDGVNLSTDVLLPKKRAAKVPAVLVRTPYDKDRVEWLIQKTLLEKFLERGYAVVLQQERGHWLSEGVYDDYLAGANTDGTDTLDWIVKQPWSNGKVGTLGCSSSGEQQWPMAAQNHPAHAAMLPLASGTAVGAMPGTDTQGAIYRGGVPQNGLWTWWYGDMVPTERLVLPPGTTQEQRIRIRNGYSFQPRPNYYKLREDGSLDWLNRKVDFPTAMSVLPAKDALRVFGGPLTPFDKYATWGPADKRWDAVPSIKGSARPRVPAIHYSTWHDIGVGETTRLFKHLQDVGTKNQYLIIGAGPHCELEEEPKFNNYTFGDLALGDIRYRGRDLGFQKLWLDWFDYWLAGKQNGVLDMPRVQLMVMNGGWVMGSKWPLPQAKPTPLYLAPAAANDNSFDTGQLAWKAPAAGAHSYVYDPAQPTPSRGGGCCEVQAAVDQRPVEARRDVLVYSTPPLEQPVTVAGPVEVVLHVSSSAKDTDFMVKLVDVLPDGKAINLADDAFRMRYREGFDKTNVRMAAGGVYKVSLPNMVTAVRFGKGHRIRLEVASSNFPSMERNLNTGGNNYDETKWLVARNTVHLGGDHASQIILPIVPN